MDTKQLIKGLQALMDIADMSDAEAERCDDVFKKFERRSDQVRENMIAQNRK